jgi:hypothetical protein
VDDFNKPKIIFQEIVQESQFMLDRNHGFFCNDTGRIIVGENLQFLIAVMNSKLFFFCIKNFYGGGALGEHGVRMKHSFFQKFPCIPYNRQIDDLSAEMVETNSKSVSASIDKAIYQSYGLSDVEIELIESQCIQ